MDLDLQNLVDTVSQLRNQVRKHLRSFSDSSLTDNLRNELIIKRVGRACIEVEQAIITTFDLPWNWTVPIRGEGTEEDRYSYIFDRMLINPDLQIGLVGLHDTLATLMNEYGLSGAGSSFSHKSVVG